MFGSGGRFSFLLVVAALCTACAAGSTARTQQAATATPVPTGTLDIRESEPAPSFPELREPHVHPDIGNPRVPFTIHFDGIDSSWSRISAFVMPGRAFDFSASGGSGSFAAQAGAGDLAATGTSSWTWTAPSDHGDHEIRVQDRSSGAVATLRVFVLHPWDGKERLGHFRIGRYPRETRYGDPAYLSLQGFVEVEADDVDTFVSPHFKIGQFLCKDQAPFPKYIVLRTELLVKLELMLEALAKRGLPARTLHVMSGYRTPAYNAAIGNKTTYSRHTYGDAADVFLDRDGDGIQDDIDGDGRSTRADAVMLYELVEQALEDSLPGHLAGGLAAYGPTRAHGPFLHVDTRGHHARW